MPLAIQKQQKPQLVYFKKYEDEEFIYKKSLSSILSIMRYSGLKIAIGSVYVF